MRRCLVWMVLVGALGSCAQSELVDASGEEIYVELCARCHGLELEGGVAPVIEITPATTDEELATVIREGVGVMPAYESTLSDDQVDRVVEYLRATSG